MKAAISITVAVFALISAIVLVRALLHTPQAIEQIDPVSVDLNDKLIGQHLAEAIRFQTVSHQRPEDFQAQEFEAFIHWVKNTYVEVHDAMELRRLGTYTLLYRWRGSNPGLQPILVTGHYDVVPVIPGSENAWQQSPFAGNIIDGIVWGRGALDDKSGVIAQLEAATHLLRSGFVPDRDIYFSFGHDEEIGGVNGAGEVAKFFKSQGIQLAWSLDEGSFVFDGMFPGVEELLATINVAEKGSVTLNIVARSAGGHSSMPPSETAVGILARAITRLEENPLPGGMSGLSEQMFDTVSRYMPFVNRMLFANRWLFGAVIEDQLSAVPTTNAMLRTTTAPTMLSGSVKVNVLPIEAVATVNFRLHPRDTVESVVEYVSSVVEDPNIEVRLPPGNGRPASRVSSWESPGFQVVERAVREIYGEVLITPGLMIAGSDTRHYGKVADDAYRFNPMKLTPEDLTGFHGTNENISVANLAQGTRTYVRIITLGSAE